MKSTKDKSKSHGKGNATQLSGRKSDRRRGLLILGTLAVVALGWSWLGRDKTIPRSALALNRTSPLAAKLPTFATDTGSGIQAAEEPALGPGFESVIGPPRWAPRAPGEWDGMRVNLNVTPPCDSSAICGLGRACKAGRCSACENDTDCTRSEGCVLEHCIRKELIECRHASDCGGKKLCVFSGYSSLPRGNEGMRAYCLDPESGTPMPPSPTEPPAKDPRTSLPGDDLLKAAREAAPQ
jgi:hypothetical protein